MKRGEVQELRNRSNRGSSTCFSSSPSTGEEVFMSDEEDVNSLSTEPEDEFSPKIQMLKLRFEEEKRRLEVEASQRNKFAVQEWMREVREKEALKKEREMEMMGWCSRGGVDRRGVFDYPRQGVHFTCIKHV